MATRCLGDWANALSYQNIPEHVTVAAVRSFYNWAGCAIGGSQHEATRIARDSLSPFFGPPVASLLGHRGSIKVDAPHAALINGIASHVHDYDDTHLNTIIHPTGPVASALLAVAEWKGGVSGKDFLAALVAGIEAECKLGLAVWPEHYDRGWHITSTTGSVGAAIAVAKILGLSVDRTVHAIGLAATQVVGLRDMFGSHTKSFHPGRAAQCGLLAAVMAQNGYTSSETALEAKRGWANVVSAGKVNIQETLGKWVSTGTSVGLPTRESGRWEILRNSFKPFPCGIVIHPVIDACVRLHQDMTGKRLYPYQIQSATVEVHPLVLELTGKKTPKDGLEGKFSVYHSGACGLVYGRATPAEYEDDVVLRPEVVAVRDKIRAEVNDAMAADQAKVTVVLEGGKRMTEYIEHAVGSLEVPLSNDMLQNKFISQCSAVLGPDHAEGASRACWKIEELEDVSAITTFL